MTSQEMSDADYFAAKLNLRSAAEAYYADGTSTMSDADYDSLLSSVAWFESVGGITEDTAAEAIAAGANVKGDVKHSVKMLSLDNLFSSEEVTKWKASLGNVDVIVEPKLDGMAMSIHFDEKGKAVKMLTRGDGEFGEDYTLALPIISNLPVRAYLPHLKELRPFTGEIRGEVIFSDCQYLAASKGRERVGKRPFANPRNAVAGTLSRASKGGELPYRTEVSFVAYGVVGLGYMFAHSQAMDRLKSMGFTTALSLLPKEQIGETPVLGEALGGLVFTPKDDKSIKIISAQGTDWTQAKPEVGFDLDGLVFKVDDYHIQEEMGESSRAPRWAKAFKYPADTAYTKLLDVKWEVGRTGSVTPRAVIETVYLAGSNLSSASLHNPNEIARLGLMLGDTVEVRKAGEIIPQILRWVEGTRTEGCREIQVPVECPNCNEVLSTAEARLRCPSGGECATGRKLTYAVSKDALDIDGMGPVVVDKLLDAGLLTDVASIFDLTVESMEPLIGLKTATKIKANIEKAKQEATFSRVLISLGIKGTGRTVCKRLAKHFGDMWSLMDAQVTELGEGAGFQKNADALYDSIYDLGPTIRRLADHGLSMRQAEESSDLPKPLADMTIVVTGSMKVLGSRSEVQSNLEALGATVGSSVSAKTTLVITDNAEGTSSKLVKARKLGIRVLEEKQFLDEFKLVYA